MLIDSFMENRAPLARNRGVSRLNTRLAFLTYEIRKLKLCQQKSQVLLRNNSSVETRSDLYRFTLQAESASFEYVFVSTTRDV